MKAKSKKASEDLRPEYDFDYSKAVRGKYCRRLLREGTTLWFWTRMWRRPSAIPPR